MQSLKFIGAMWLSRLFANLVDSIGRLLLRTQIVQQPDAAGTLFHGQNEAILSK